MSVRRSPPGTPSGIGDRVKEPEFNLEGDAQITYRKRKKPDDNNSDLMTKFSDFKGEILSILQEFANVQNNNLKKISDDVASIKQQTQIIEQKTDSILMEQNKLKNEISELRSRYNSAELKIESLEKDIQKLKKTSSSAANQTDAVHHCEDMLSEMRERVYREKNIIITGIPELISTKLDERIKHDMNEVTKIVKMANVNSIPVHCMRLGKYKPGSSRSIKAIFATSDDVKNILKNRSNVEGDIKIFSDITPQQQKYLKNIKDQLKTRVSNGEDNITIKYIRGVPKIVKQQPKN